MIALLRSNAFCHSATVEITIQLPDDRTQLPDPARKALEMLAIEGYRSGALSSQQTRLLLGFQTSSELDAFLKENGVWEHAYGVDDWSGTLLDLIGEHDRRCRYFTVELPPAD